MSAKTDKGTKHKIRELNEDRQPGDKGKSYFSLSGDSTKQGIYWDPDGQVGPNFINVPSFCILGHEISHSIDFYAPGGGMARMKDPPKFTGNLNWTEERAVEFENQIRMGSNRMPEFQGKGEIPIRWSYLWSTRPDALKGLTDAQIDTKMRTGKWSEEQKSALKEWMDKLKKQQIIHN